MYAIAVCKVEYDLRFRNLERKVSEADDNFLRARQVKGNQVVRPHVSTGDNLPTDTHPEWKAGTDAPVKTRLHMVLHVWPRPPDCAGTPASSLQRSGVSSATMQPCCGISTDFSYPAVPVLRLLPRGESWRGLLWR